MTLQLITGPMFSGKSTELMRRLKRAKIAKRSVLLFKPEFDSRKSGIHSHDGEEMDAIRVSSFSEIQMVIEDNPAVDYIGIDEFQFFKDVIPRVIVEWSRLGINVIMAGLDLDQNDNPFRAVRAVFPYADDISKLKSVCIKCNEVNASRSQWVSDLPYNEITRIGGLDKYEPRCLSCFVPYEEIAVIDDYHSAVQNHVGEVSQIDK